MELNARQQKLAFAIIVVMLAGLGIYLLLPAATAGQHAAAPAPSATTAPSQPAPVAPQVQPSAVPLPSAGSGVNIYQWLPFTQDDLARAASVTTQAAGYYDTYSYHDTAAVYGSRMSGLVTSPFLRTLEADFATFGVAQQRTRDQEISSASATVTSLRSFGPTSLTFVVTISQQIKNVRGTTTATSQLAVTAVNAGGASWQVDQIQPVSTGNQ
jgi:hypothetical protein